MADLLIFYIKKYRSSKNLTHARLLVIIIINRLFAVFVETPKNRFTDDKSSLSQKDLQF